MTFDRWLSHQVGFDPATISSLKLEPAFEVLACRIDAARARGATAPLVTASASCAGGNSRRVTRRMLDQLGYGSAQRRIVQRLLAGSPGGWPGLLALYLSGAPVSGEQRRYARRQARLYAAAPSRDCAG